jgi:4,5-dihydroxyphthalate decarboxylase
MERAPETSHGGATGFKPPPGVKLEYIPPSTNIGEMMQNGTLDATLLYLPNRNLVDRSSVDLSNDPRIGPLFPDVLAESHRYFAKTGIYPINHCFAVRRSIVARDASIPRRIYDAFLRSKQIAEARLRSLAGPLLETGVLNPAAIGGDPMVYGIAGARKVLETATRFSHEQGLTDRRVALDELFAASTLDT